MKPIKKQWLSLAIAPLLFALMGVTSQAQATTYTSCSSVPASVSGDADISDSGACVISHSVTADGGHISITAPSVSVQDLTANYDITVISAGAISINGGITTGLGAIHLEGTDVAVAGNTSSTYNITIVGTGTIQTQNLSSAYHVDLQTDGDVTVTGTILGFYDYVKLKGDKVTASGMITAGGELTINADSEIDVHKLTSQWDLKLETPDTVTVTGEMKSLGGSIDIKGDKIEVTDKVDSHFDITMKADSQKIDTRDLKAGYKVDLQVEDDQDIKVDGDIETENSYVYLKADNAEVTGDITVTERGNILLLTQHNLKTGSLTGGQESNIDVKVNRSGANTPFTIGGSNEDNGINGTITSNPESFDAYYAPAIIFITNGTPSSTGGIVVTDGSKFVTTPASSGRAAFVWLDAREGTINITGTLSSSGGATGGAGQVMLNAKKVIFGANSALNANQGASVTGTLHAIHISAEEIDYDGASGLTLNADGNGIDSGTRSSVALFPKDSMLFEDGEDPQNLPLWVGLVSNLTGDISIQGAGSAPFIMSADGNDTTALILADVLTTSGGNFTLQSRGASNHMVEIVNLGVRSAATTGLVVNNTGNFKLDASGIGGAGGVIHFWLDKAEINSATASFIANGPSSGNGDGGIIDLHSYGLKLGASTIGTVAADAASSGTGNASETAITFYPGEIDFDLGTTGGKFRFSAKGGSSSGNGGTIELNGYESEVTVNGAGAVTTVLDVSAPGANGNGGKIHFVAYGGLTFDGSASYLKADSGSVSGDGGTIDIETSNYPFVIGTGSASAVDLSAVGLGSGKGGKISVLSYSGITADSAHISVNAGTTGQGGIINLNAGWSEMSLSGTFDASGGSGSGDNKGGEIQFTSGTLSLSPSGNTEVIANGHGSGKGGVINILTHYGDINVASGTSALSLEATSDNNDGGDIILEAESGSALNLAGAAINVSAGSSGGDGTGGTINARTADGKITVVGILLSNGHGDGAGGDIILTGDELDLSSATLQAEGGSTGAGGVIDLESKQALTITGSQVSVSAGTGSGSNGDGGELIIESTEGTINASGNFSANGQGSGNGGEVIFASHSSTTLSLSSALTKLFANSGANGGNGGTIDVSNSGGSVEFVNGAEVRATAGSGTGNGGTITISAGGSAEVGNVTIGSAAEVEADGGLSAGNGGYIVIAYSDAGGFGYIDTSYGTVTADGTDGKIEFYNAQTGASTLNLSGLSTTISADGGQINFNGLNGDIVVNVSNAVSPGPLVGIVSATGEALDLFVVSNSDLLIGDITATNLASIVLFGAGDLSSEPGTKITASSLLVGTDNGTIGSANPLLTSAETIIPSSSSPSKSVDIRNDIGFTATVLADGWEVTDSFYLYAPYSISVGDIEKAGGNDGFIQIDALAGTMTVRGGSTILATQGSIILSVATIGGSMVVGSDANIKADANGGGVLLGNLSLTVTPPASPAACGVIANFDSTLSAPAPQCGPFGFTAASPTNYGVAVGRGLLIYSPDAASLTLGGNVRLNAVN